QAETKLNTITLEFQAFNSGITATGDFQYVLPVIQVGTGSNNRIGDTIKPIKLVIEGYIAYRMDLTGGTINDQSRLLGARLFVFQDKATRAYQNNIFNYNLLDNGSSSESYTGTARNWIQPHNEDQFKWFADKKFKILKPYGYTNIANGSTITPAIANMNTTLFHKFKITIPSSKMPASIRYDSTDSTSTPINFCPMLALGYSDLMNYSADTLTTQLGMSYRSTLYFKDC
ncbi:unnamed protein product, partial [Rotaria socialis]